MRIFPALFLIAKSQDTAFSNVVNAVGDAVDIAVDPVGDAVNIVDEDSDDFDPNDPYGLDIITTTVAPISDCTLTDHLNGTTSFMSPKYYTIHMECFAEKTCKTAGDTIHFKFDYFHTTKDFDKLWMKSPDTGEEGIEDDWNMVFSGHKVIQKYGNDTWTDTGVTNMELEFHSDYEDSNGGGLNKDIGFKVALQCAPSGSLEPFTPAATGQGRNPDVVQAEIILGAIQGIGYALGGLFRLIAGAPIDVGHMGQHL